MRKNHDFIKRNILILLSFVLSSCATLFGDDGVYPKKTYDYLNSEEKESLRFSDVSSYNNINDLYPIPDLELNKAKLDKFVVPRVASLSLSSEKGGVVLQRLNKNHWILVNSSINQVWPLIDGFLNSNKINFNWIKDSKGIIETEWLSSSYNLNKKSEKIYDRYRITLSSGVQNSSTEIRVLHLQSPEPNYDLSWNIQSSDKDKEKNMLNLIAESIANNTLNSSYSLLAQGVTTSRKVSLLYNTINNPYLYLELPFDRSWASLGLALQKTSFKVNDLDRNDGIYFVTFIDDKKEKEESFLSKIFKKKNSEPESPNDNFEFFTEYDDGLIIQVRRSSGLSLTNEEKLALLRKIKNKLS